VFGFISRAVLILVWISIMIIGAMFLTSGFIQFEASRAIPPEVNPELKNMRASVGVMAIITMAIGLSGILYGLMRTVRDLARPLDHHSQMRADTPEMRVFYALGFATAIGLSIYTLLDHGDDNLKALNAYIHRQEATAKIISVSAETLQSTTQQGGLYRLKDINKPGQITGTYIYYTNTNKPVTITGPLPYRSVRYQPRPGDTFKITYNPKHPETPSFGARPKFYLLVPIVFETILLLFMLSGGVTGLWQNLSRDEKYEHQYP